MYKKYSEQKEYIKMEDGSSSRTRYTIPEEDMVYIDENTILPKYFISAMCNLFEEKADPESGAISKETFVELFRGRKELSTELKNFLIALFTAFDNDKNKKMDFRELIEMLNIFLCGDKMEKIAGIFRMCDADGNNGIDRGEMEAFMLTLAVFDRGNMPRADRERNLKETAHKIFEAFDTDKDRIINVVEFQKGCEKNPEMIEEIEYVIKVCIGQGF